MVNGDVRGMQTPSISFKYPFYAFYDIYPAEVKASLGQIFFVKKCLKLLWKTFAATYAFK